ncbi:hypothetical protein OG792_32840 [Micromonospora sp. NBC_01699]|uniref:hypothetical protein n=1 Tax=Micromonospora sp. NBC_01699 TaxID=2975984 RepID=UPI002E28CED8|nr:hypothetical protein [Micromonospora sp. NBC_01699]
MTARSAAKAEALGVKIAFTHEDVSYEMDPAMSWDLDAMEAFEDGNLVTCIRLILGPEQYAKFKPRGTKRTVGDLSALFETIQKAAGTPN